MAPTLRSSPKKSSKASKASKASKGSKGTPRTAAKAPVGVTKPRKATQPTPPKTPRTHGGRFRQASSSPGTISPDEIPETEFEDSDDVRERNRKLERQLARLRGDRNSHLQGHRVTDSPYRPRGRSRHRARYSPASKSSSEDREDGDTNRVSFTHLEGTRPFITLQSRYRSVDIKYFKQILHGNFRAEDLTKLGRGLTNRGTSDGPQDPKGVTQLLQCFGVYAVAVIYYSRSSARLELAMALEEYRYRLAEYSYAYKFDSLREYNYAFMTARILEGQDDALAWRAEDQRCHILLRLKTSSNEATKPPVGNAAKSVPPGYGICRNFNEGRCTREHCKYSHICLNCQQAHAANTCQKTQTAASAANSTPLGNRVSRPE